MLLDLGAEEGTWAKVNNGAFVKQNVLSSVNMVTCDLDNSGQAELVLDFASPRGIWITGPTSGRWA